MKHFLYLILSIVAATAFAVPTTEEVYRNNDLNIIVYKDGLDQNIFWYLPPVKLFEEQDRSERTPRVTLRKATNGMEAEYYFYLLPYMNRDLESYLRNEIPGLRNRSQLKPLKITKMKMVIKQFNTVAETQAVTDFQYINKPHEIKVTVPMDRSEEFDSFANSLPGIYAYVVFFYESERMDKRMEISISCKEVHDALNIQASGRYDFLRADVEVAIGNYLDQKYYTVNSKGDLPIPEVVSKALESCFKPNPVLRKAKEQEDKDDDDEFEPRRGDNAFDDEEAAADEEDTASGAIKPPFSGGPKPQNGLVVQEEVKKKPKAKRKVPKKAAFKFKKELAKSDRNFFYKQEHYVDASEAIAIPFYLTTVPQSNVVDIDLSSVTTKSFVVDEKANRTKPFRTGFVVGGEAQFTIESEFSYKAKFRFPLWNGELFIPSKSYDWDASWPSVDNDLYYRVGDMGEWVPVNGRALVNSNTLGEDEIQLYLDKRAIWNKIPKNRREGSSIFSSPPKFDYDKFYPEFRTTISGKTVFFKGYGLY